MEFIFKDVKTIMSSVTYSRFLRFLQEELAIPTASIAVAQRHWEQDPGSLPMILWRYGLVTLEQLQGIYDWLESAQA